MLSLVQRPFWSAVVALIVLPAASLPAAEYFFDDFENYFSDEELLEVGGWQVMEVNTPVESAAWTVLNPKGRGNPATANGLPTDGQFIISDSDAAPQDPGDLPGTGMSHDIWSPSFSCAGATKVWLHMDSLIQMNNNGLCVFDVDVSTNDGTSWTNVYRRVAPSRSVPPVATLDNADGYLGRIDVDITTQAAGKPSVMFRLRQFEPNDDWYFSIDNVLVDDVAAPSGGAVNLLFERFSAGIPDSWEIASFADPPNEGTSTWNSEDACKRSALRFNGGKLPYQDGHGLHRLDAGYAILDSECDPDPAEDEYLITPTVDCSKATSVFFHFKSEINASTAATQVVLLSLDGGANFSETPIFTYYDTTNGIGSGFISVEDPFYAERVLEVPEAVGQSEVAFAFRYQSGGDEGWWAVDDVKVSAEGAGLPTRNCVNREFDVQPYDSATLSVTMTWKGIAGDGGFRILANGTQIGGDLPPTATTFTDNAPPAGGSVAYSLQTIVGGNVEFECTAPPLSVLSCPRDLTCCVNQTAGTVSLNWKNGSNLAGTGYRILRNNVPRATVGLAATSFVDDTVPGPGTYEYTLVLNGGNPAQCPDLPLKSSAIVLDASSAVFYDDFECYADDAAVSAAGWEFHEVGPPPLETAKWTVTDPGGRGNPPGPDGNATYGSRFLISDSDAGGGDDRQGSGRSHDVWTPRLDCTGKTPVWLHAACTLVLNNNGECMFEVDASNDNGSTWTNVFRRVAPARSRNGFIATCIGAGRDGGRLQRAGGRVRFPAR
jgi:hypothetical protein